MHRNFTNIIRTLMDEWIPPVIRDSKWFMYPFFYYWYRGDHNTIKAYMNFKSRVYQMTHDEYEHFYTHQRANSRAASRITDLNDACIQFMINNLDSSATTLLDIGCGNGYFLQQLSQLQRLHLFGCDVMPEKNLGDSITYLQGNLLQLPFADKSFDIVTCHHTIEHIPSVYQAIAEIKRIAKKQVMIVTPRQRYYYYTLDEHVNFFPEKGILEFMMDIPQHQCHDLDGDWMYVGSISEV